MNFGTGLRLAECISEFRCDHELYPANLLKICHGAGSCALSSACRE
jgi:hypothetical protein